MHKIKNLALYLTALLLAFSFTTCSDDDDDYEGDPIPSALIGTWNMGDYLSVTFKSNGKGTATMSAASLSSKSLLSSNNSKITRSTATESGTITYSFTYIYTEANSSISMTVEDETTVWYIEELTDSTLSVRSAEDSDGTLTLTKETNNSGDDDDNNGGNSSSTTIDTDLLVGDWGWATNKMFTFTENSLTIYSEEQQTYNVTYNNSAVQYMGYTMMNILTLSEDMLLFNMGSNMGATSVFRMTDDEWTIGGITQIINNTWYSAYDGEETYVTFSEDGIVTTIIRSEEGGTEVDKGTYSYNSGTKQLTLIDDDETTVITVVRLTDSRFVGRITYSGDYNDNDYNYIEYVAQQ